MTLSITETLTSPALPTCENVTLEVRIPGQRSRRLAVLHDEFLIGRAEICDLRIEDGDIPLVHSELHRQAGVLWIEACDEEIVLDINDRTCVRLALRNGDRLRIGNREVIFHIGEDRMPMDDDDEPLQEDLSELSADELCERILTEQSEVAEFERRQFEGWKRLVTALETTVADGRAGLDGVSVERIESALTELKKLSAALNEQTRQLAEQEAEVLDVTSELRTSQEAMSRKLDQLLDRFGEGELRASA